MCVIKGPIVSDVVSFSGTKLSAQNYFGTITFMNTTFPNIMSAILGLSTAPAFNESNPFRSLVQQGELDNIFSVCIFTDNGTLTLGGMDPKMYSGHLETTPMINKTFAVNMLQLEMDGHPLPFNASVFSQQGAPIIDTGTYSLVIPTRVYSKIYEWMNATCRHTHLVGVCDEPYSKSLFSGVCYPMKQNDINIFPTFQLKLENATLFMPPFNYLIPDYSKPDNFCFGIQDGGDPTLTILGDTVLKGIYTVFDLENWEFRFAKATGNCVPNHH